MDYTLGKTIRLDPYHAPLLHSQLTKHLGSIFGPVNEEIVTALDDLLSNVRQGESYNGPAEPGAQTPSLTDWTTVPILDVTRQIVLRATNRALVGRPLCV